MSESDTNMESYFSLKSGGTQKSDDPPFHVLCLGDWSGSGENKIELSERRPVLIDRDNFDDVIRKIRPQVSLEFEGENTLILPFAEFEDFHPDSIFRQIPLFEKLRDIRKKLKSHETFYEASQEVRSWFRANEREFETKDGDTIDADNLLDLILSGNSTDASMVKRKSNRYTELGQFISDIVKPHVIHTDLGEQANLLSAVDDVISDLMCKILHHKDFLALESAWRGLYFLVRRTDTDTDLKIYLLDISKEELANNLKSVSTLADSIYARWTSGEPLESMTGEPWAFVCANYQFSPNVDDIATLMRVSKISAASNTPFISQITSEVLGVSSLAGNPNSTNWNISDESNEWKIWNALRLCEESEYLGMAMPRFLARLPYGRDTEPTELFAFEEFSGNHEDYVWANPSFACAYLLARSFRKNGWKMAENIAREIDGLPTHFYRHDGETKTKPCAEITMTEASVQKMVEAGVIPLVSFRDSDRVRVASFQSVALSGERIRGRWH